MVVAMLLGCAFFLIACDVKVTGLRSPVVKVRVRVVEEDGSPIFAAKATCTGGLGSPTTLRASPSSSGFTIQPDGDYTATITSSEGIARASAEKRGYYFNGSSYRSVGKGSDDPLESHKTGSWNDDEQFFEVILRQVKSPVPMKVKEIAAPIPVKEQWVGYDLEVGDWVAPYGAGKVADFEFYSESTYESDIEYSGKMTLRVPGEGNGIQGFDVPDEFVNSQFRGPYEAPEDGYEKGWDWIDARTTKGMQFSEITDESFPNRMFVFRVRSEFTDWGRLRQAKYGKIYGPFRWGARTGDKGGFLNFIYYLNPEGTRNLEYDPKQNLFPQEPNKSREYKP